MVLAAGAGDDGIRGNGVDCHERWTIRAGRAKPSRERFHEAQQVGGLLLEQIVTSCAFSRPQVSKGG
jgi:hypothetical protein